MEIRADRLKVFVLLGYMGSGKSTVGQQLALRLNVPHIDLDDYIEANEHSSISALIEEKGILYFRKRERFYLEEVLHSANRKVVSLGGGTPCYYNSMDWMVSLPHVNTFYLQANVPFLTSRLFNERSNRPLISRFDTMEDLAEFIGKHLLERSLFYHQAKHTIPIEGKTVQQLVLEIAELG